MTNNLFRNISFLELHETSTFVLVYMLQFRKSNTSKGEVLHYMLFDIL
jgi:hypothetical protein